MKKTSASQENCCNQSESAKCGGSPAIYGMGFVGALVFYVTTAGSFWLGIVGIVKAIFWPAFLVYEALSFLIIK